MENPIHNSFHYLFRSPLGAAKTEQSVTFRMRCGWNVMGVTLRIQSEDGMITEHMCYQFEGMWECELKMPPVPQVLWYDFYLRFVDGGTSYYIPQQGKRGGVGRLSPKAENKYQLTVQDKDFVVPKWFCGGVMYQIFPDRYAIGNPKNREIGAKYHADMGQRVFLHATTTEDVDYLPRDGAQYYEPVDYYGGDFAGIEQGIPRLANLGVTVLYLNPIVEAASNHRYNTSDYLKCDPFLGTNDDFARLCHTAQQHGIRILLDGVYSHTGDDSIYFNKYGHYPGVGAYQSTDSPYSGWYIFNADRSNYQSWWNFASLPEVDEHNDTWQNFIYRAKDSVFSHWHQLGGAGFRLDVADELPDDVIFGMRSSLKEIDDQSVLLGEVWEDATTKESYGSKRKYALGKGLDSVMNYPFRGATIAFLLQRSNAGDFCNFLLEQQANYPQQMYYSLMNLLSSHDVARILTVLSTGTEGKDISRQGQLNYPVTDQMRENGLKAVKLAVAIQQSIPGVPSIYYGDEYGMEGFSDPFNRRFLNREYDGLLPEYKRWATLRKEYGCLTGGYFTAIPCGYNSVALLRFSTDQTDALDLTGDGSFVVTLIHAGEEDMELQFDLNQADNGLPKQAVEYLKTHSFSCADKDVTCTGSQFIVSMPAKSSRVLILKEA